MSRIIWAIDREGYPPFPKNEIWFLNEKDLYFDKKVHKNKEYSEGHCEDAWRYLTFKLEDIHKEVRMKKFKVGDFIKGVSSHYVFTNQDMLRGKIIDIQGKDTQILILEHKDPTLNGGVYWACFAQDEDFELYKENKTKKATFILLPTTKDNIEGFVVKGWENVLKRNELPERYFFHYPLFHEVDGDITIDKSFGEAFFLKKGDFVSKEKWDYIYQSMLQAGHRLSKILEEQRKPKEIRVEI